MTDRLAGIREFVAVVEASGFAAAATRLNLSRSAVGKTIARLEERLGARLCHRTTRTLSLTDDGKAFYEHCVRALAELEAAEASLEFGRTVPAGRVRVAAPVIFGRRCVAPVLYGVARQHPGLILEIAFSDRPVEIIEEGYDLAVRNGNLPEASGLMTRSLARQRMTVCASPAYLEKHGSPATLADLPTHQAIDYANATRTRNWLFPDGKGKTIEVPMKGRIRLDDLEAMMDAAIAGMGLAWLPCWLIRSHVASGDLVPLLRDIPAMEFRSSALWPQSPVVPSRVRVMIDALAAELPAMMGG
jgi:DNA-binding transcriptional LysR family regulator